MFGPSTSINDPRAHITITSPNYTKGDTNIVDVLTPEQYAIIQQIHDQYTYEMAERNYDNIPGDYNQYLTLLNSLNTINVSNTTMQFMIDMVEKALIGSMNIVTLNDSAMYNELQILLLNNRINEILTDKNTINVVSESSNVSGQFSLQKTFKLSKIYSYYIHLYGMPAFGVGFDRKKLLFLQKALDMYQNSSMDTPGATVSVASCDPSGNSVDVPLTNPLG